MGLRSSIKKKIESILKGVAAREQVNVPLLAGSLLEGKCALITGGTSGIGLAIAEAFLRNGASVTVAARSQSDIDDVVSKLSDLGSIRGERIDVSSPSSISTGVAQSFDSMGRVDILVNSAGIIGKCKFGSIEPDEFDRVIDTNLRGTAMISQEVARLMVDRGIRGNILNIASSSGLRPATTAYMMSKWGVRGLTLGMAKALITHGIVVNGLAPGPTATAMLGMDGESDLTNPAVPAGRYATPEEVADMAVVLTSSIGRMVVGDVVYMTGGSGLLTYDDIRYGF